MADFTKVLLIVLGVFSLAGGVIGAGFQWPWGANSVPSYEQVSANLDAILLRDQGRITEARELEAKNRAIYGVSLSPLEIETAQFVAVVWLASGLVSLAFL